MIYEPFCMLLATTTLSTPLPHQNIIPPSKPWSTQRSLHLVDGPCRLTAELGPSLPMPAPACFKKLRRPEALRASVAEQLRYAGAGPRSKEDAVRGLLESSAAEPLDSPAAGKHAWGRHITLR